VLLGNLGEKKFLAQLLPKLRDEPRVLNGIGQDAAAIEVSPNSDLVLFLKIDRAAQPTAAIRGWADFGSWGRLAVTANCSDVLASGGSPIAMMLSMILPKTFNCCDAEKIVIGCESECLKHGVSFAGGDTKEGSEPQLVGCALGLGHRNRIWSRSGAMVGDALVLAGVVGGYLGAYLQMQELDQTDQSRSRRAYCDYLSHPVAKWHEAMFMTSAADVRSAMDVSDGLYDALSCLSEGFGVIINESDIPIHPFAQEYARKYRISPISLAFGVGDWGILYGVESNNWNSLEHMAKNKGLMLTRIGEITEGPNISLKRKNGEIRQLRPIKNEHFSQNRLEEKRYASMFSEDYLFL
jgi:thiamine-monophosphate kinase